MPLSQENRIQMAVAAYKNQKVKSKLKAAEIFGVPEATLALALKEDNHTQKHVLMAID